MRSFTGILKYLNNYLGYLALNILFNVLAVLFSLASISMIIPFLSLLFGKQELVEEPPELSFSVDTVIGYFNYYLSNIIEQEGRVSALIFICVVVVVVFFFKNLFRYGSLFVMAPIRNGVVRDIRKNLFNKALRLPLSFYSEERKGDIITRMTSDVHEIEQGIMRTLEVAFRHPITIIAYLGAMVFMSPMLTIFVLVMLVVTGLIIGGIGRSLKRTSSKGQHKLSTILSTIEETLSGMRIIKAFNAGDYQASKFNKDNESHFRIVTRMLRKRELSSPLSEFLAISVIAIVLYVGGKMVIQSDDALSAETFIGFMVIFSQLIAPAKSFSQAFYKIQQGLASVDRIEKVLQAPLRIEEKEDAKPLTSFQHSIEYKDVCFRYEQELVLNHINLRFDKGKIIAIVGPSGAGKSTLVDLLPRFYDPVEGSITIDGIDLRDVKIDDLRSLMGVVSQDPILFNDTVYNNIAFGMEHVSQDDVEQAARVANAHVFISQLANGYQTTIGEMGNKLSGGQKQRLTIARAILANPPILVMDEATSSLDTESEKLVQEALFNLMQNRTAIVIAHRLSTIQSADEIVVMEEGKVKEKGNHTGLMAQDGLYKKLVDMQAF